MGALETGTGAAGGVSGAALGTFVGLVAGNIEFEESFGRDIEFEATAATVNDGAGGNGQAAFLLHDADGFASGAAGGPDVFDDKSFFAGFEFKAAAQGHLTGTIAFDEDGANAEPASDFMADDQAAQGGRYDTGNVMVFKHGGDGAAKFFGVLRMLEHERALDVGGAVAAAGQFEMSGADGADGFEKFYDFVASHR